jgi:polyisoprenoid-binding protein YceI
VNDITYLKNCVTLNHKKVLSFARIFIHSSNIETEETKNLFTVKKILMKKQLKKSIVLIAICIAGFNCSIYAQSIYKISSSKDNDMKLSGTSTLHNWTMDTKTFTGDAQFGLDPANADQLTSIKSLTFSLAVLNLKSGENGLDKNAYKALKTNQHKNIHYKLVSATIIHREGNKYLIKTQGTLKIAGVTKTVAMDVNCVVNKDASITCTGSDKINMSDYQVKPPTFMLGVMKTGDAITLDFTLVYKK